MSSHGQEGVTARPKTKRPFSCSHRWPLTAKVEIDERQGHLGLISLGDQITRFLAQCPSFTSSISCHVNITALTARGRGEKLLDHPFLSLAGSDIKPSQKTKHSQEAPLPIKVKCDWSSARVLEQGLCRMTR